MAIAAVHIGNFKGIDGATRIPLKPLTIFIGPNSSGKSTCLHALAALSQSVKLPNNSRPLSLDDEFAYVHLGRFIEVIHSKSYSDPITLGLEFDAVRLPQFASTEVEGFNGTASAIYKFKCAMRTQELRLDEAKYQLGASEWVLRRTKTGSELASTKDGAKLEVACGPAFLLEQSFSRSQPSIDSKRFYPILIFQREIRNVLQRVLYLGPFRQPPLRRYPTHGASPTEVGPQGEGTITLLANEAVQKRNRPHITQISGWLSKLGLARAVDVARVGRSDQFDVNMEMTDGKRFPIADLGYGLSQVLPVLTQCSFASPGSTLLFEQPELHLHSVAARPLLEVLLETSRRGVQVVAETHSPEFVKQLQEALRRKMVTKDEFHIYRVSREAGQSVIAALEIDDDGDVYENWEKGLSIK